MYVVSKILFNNTIPTPQPHLVIRDAMPTDCSTQPQEEEHGWP